MELTDTEKNALLKIAKDAITAEINNQECLNWKLIQKISG